MKHSLDTYRLYNSEKRYSAVVRMRFIMKDTVDKEILEKSVNRAIKRYPFFSVKVRLDEDGAYILVPNSKPVAVLTSSGHLPLLGSRAVNGHLVFVDCRGKNIFFNISHSLAGGKGIFPWIMTSVYEYVCDRYGVKPYAPMINKWDSDLKPTETAEPDMSDLTDEPPVYTYRSKKPVMMIKDYLTGVYDPFRRCPNYRIFTVRKQDLIPFIKVNDSSVTSFFIIAMAKAMDKVLPGRYRVIGGETAHNPRDGLGMPDTHADILSHVYIDYDREYLKESMEKLGTMTRGQIILQTDPTVSQYQLRKRFELYNRIDETEGLENKRRYMTENDTSSGKDAVHGTFIMNYTGQVDLGELADYIEFYGVICEGHLLLEATSLGDRIFVTMMQLINENKYADAFRETLEELGIPCTVSGPYRKNLTKHLLPKEKKR